MRSKISFFNPGLSRSLLRRSWPIWLAYFSLQLIMVPGSLMSRVESYSHRSPEQLEAFSMEINRLMLRCGIDTVTLAFFACVLVAMAMFGYMYNNRSTSMYCAMPMRRETVFSTAFITGLVPMLLTNLLIALICLAFFSGEGMVEVKNILLYLCMAVLANIAFFGFASFCAVLTGHILILPAVYVVLSAAAVLAENGIRTAIDTVVYGYTSGPLKLDFLSPISKLTVDLHVQTIWEYLPNGNMIETGIKLNGFNWLLIYCAAGLVFAFFALMIYRRRNMESCGDVVAVPILKPIFRYCMCFGVALMFAYAVHSTVFRSFTTGATEAAVYLVLLFIGAFIGYFSAEMLMQKTLRAFSGKWKGFFISCAAFALFVGICEFDLTGYEKRVPKAEDVALVKMDYYDGCEYTQPENIEELIAFHEQMIEQKSINEHCSTTQALQLNYELKNGKSLSRRYYISYDIEQQRDENANINTLGRVVNLREAIVGRATTRVPVTEYNITEAVIYSHYIEDGQHRGQEIRLSAQQAAEFYNECILPDAMDGKLCRVFPVNNEEYFSKAGSASFSFCLVNDNYNKNAEEKNWHSNYKDFVIYLDAERCCRWIEENTDIRLVSVGENDPEYMENQLRLLNG